MMKEEFLDSYNGYHLGFPMDPMEPPSLYRHLGDDHSDDDAICERYRRVNLSPWVGWPSGGRNPKQAWGALGRK